MRLAVKINYDSSTRKYYVCISKGKKIRLKVNDQIITKQGIKKISRIVPRKGRWIRLYL